MKPPPTQPQVQSLPTQASVASSSTQVIKDALNSYDVYSGTLQSLLSTTSYTVTRTTSPRQRSTISFYSKSTGALIFSSDIETIATYYNKPKLWVWSWNNYSLLESETTISRSMLYYGLETNLIYLKALLTTPRMILHDKVQIEINLALTGAIVKNHCIVPLVFDVEQENAKLKQNQDDINAKANATPDVDVDWSTSGERLITYVLVLDMHKVDSYINDIAKL
ncbi:Hypothetical protein MVR_LOCUS174 [uncultured virus]|nr:Hypothetical protein MVR_LOCUS174 [uncultured virus]